MLKRLYIDNFRAMTNFTLEFKPKQLLLGLNGTGKTTVFDVLFALRQFVVEGEKSDALFTVSTLPRWLVKREQRFDPIQQRFELTLTGGDGEYTYALLIEQRDAAPRTRVVTERLDLEGKPLFEFAKGEVQLFRDNHSAGPSYPFDWGRSGLTTILPRHDNKKLTWFKERLREVYCIRIDAPRMSARAEREAPFPARDFSNFAAWYRDAAQAHSSANVRFVIAIRDVIDELDGLDLKPSGQGVHMLRASFSTGDASVLDRPSAPSFSLDFDELSDGQRALIGLYSLLHFALRPGSTLCIDEPDNFVALAEIQPWLFEVIDSVDDEGSQAIFASHHPELLNMLAPDYGVVLERQGCGPVRVGPFAGSPGSTLPPAEQIARGWERA